MIVDDINGVIVEPLMISQETTLMSSFLNNKMTSRVFFLGWPVKVRLTGRKSTAYLQADKNSQIR